jgi:predicted TIM-barrel fold metal-dependent hydrolase
MTSSSTFRGLYHRTGTSLHEWAALRDEEPIEADLPIIDTHHHLLDDEARTCYLMPELLADTSTGHTIVATVFIETGAMYRREGLPEFAPVGEVEFANGIAAMGASGCYGDTRTCAAIIGHADLTLGHDVRPVLEALIAAGDGRLRGIRDGVAWDKSDVMKFQRRQPPQHRLLDSAFRAGFAELEPLGLSFDVWLFHPQLQELADLLHEFPTTNVILDHVGGPLGHPPHNLDRDFDTWAKDIRTLATFPNLTIKLGGLAMVSCGFGFHLYDEPPSSDQLAQTWRPYIETCIDAFGPERCMMESNFPVDKQSCGYGVLWNAMKRITTGCSPEEKTAMYHDTATRVYRLDAGPTRSTPAAPPESAEDRTGTSPSRQPQ